MAFWVFSISSYSMANIRMIDYILSISWWIAIILSMPTILAFADSHVEHWIILLGILILICVPLAFVKL